MEGLKMISIYEASVLDLLPPNLKQDPDMIAAAKSLDADFLMVVNEAKQCILLPRIDSLSEDILDMLAWQMHVDFYDATLNTEVKRSLIKNAYRIHKFKGTPAAVEELISTVFDSGEVVEWFDYGGDPYKFRVITANESVTVDKAEQFVRALNSVKNMRSWLDKVVISTSDNLNLYFAGVVHQADWISLEVKS